jgi:hypothetical protein
MTETALMTPSDNLTLTTSVQLNDTGPQVKLVQEWLSLNGIGVSIDGDFGPATDAAVKRFQSENGLIINGLVDQATFEKLATPMANALLPIDPSGQSIASLTLAYANQHLAQRPREVGGDNCGPWVRLYMDGHQGVAWPWCAGFACFCLKAACDALKTALPFTPSFSCTYMAVSAEHNGIFLGNPTDAQKSDIKPGAIFLLEKTSTYWQHTGIVTSVGKDHFETIEGNTNENGSTNGYEVCTRVRGFKKMDFILLKS